MTDILEITRQYSGTIKNGRTLSDVVAHLKSEVHELSEELHGEPGEDGVVGECVDVILCALDAIFVHDKNITNIQIQEIVLKKLGKWSRRYANSIDGDRNIN
jgi:hypothetical protein